MLLFLFLQSATSIAPSPSPWPNCSSSSSSSSSSSGGGYSVSVLKRDPLPDDRSLVSHRNGSSDFQFNFASAWFPLPEGGGSGGGGGGQGKGHGNRTDGLVVRVVECNPDHHSCANRTTHPEWTNAGALTVVEAAFPADASGGASLSVAHISAADVTFAGATPPPRSAAPQWGAADPRIAYRPAARTYYLTWDNCTQNCYPHRTTLLSTTADPRDPEGWTLHGPLLPGVYTGGASLLFRDPAADDAGASASAPAPHLAFVGNSNTAAAILLAESADGLVWAPPANASRRVFMEGRPGCWDEPGVAAGPQPERLSSGDYLYIYNVDTGFPYHPNPVGRCAIGWAILDGSDPSRIVARSDEPLLTATLPWETCAAVGKGYECQEPEVVFSTGMKPLGNDEFFVFYGAADTDVGVARIKVVQSE
jgi:predicted GH43/DUF377 family glycosyl hydrolase